MRAVITTEYGNEKVLKIEASPIKKLKPHQIRVENEYFSVNPVDYKVRNGEFKILSGKKPPAVLGADFSGKVIELGGKVKDIKVGDRVSGMLNPFKGGAYSRNVICDEKHISKIPDEISFSNAAAIPLAGLTAYQALKRISNLQTGDRVVINGATGGVGHLAIQIAKNIGAEVIAVCNPDNIELAIKLGADQVYSYQEKFLDRLEKIDVFFDVAATYDYSSIKDSLKDKGRYITTLPSASIVMISPLLNIFRSKKELFVSVKPSRSNLSTIFDLLEKTKIKVLIHRDYQLDDISTAHKLIQKGGVIGKIVVATR